MNRLECKPIGKEHIEAAKIALYNYRGENAMIYEITDTNKVSNLFEGWNETLIYSCLQKVMGKIFVTDLDNPN